MKNTVETIMNFRLEHTSKFGSWIYWGVITWGVLIILAMLVQLATAGETRVNVNTATKIELEQLKGIGPVKASRIIEMRPFVAVDSLINVKGIGPKTMAKIQGVATVTDSTHIHVEDEQ